MSWQNMVENLQEELDKCIQREHLLERRLVLANARIVELEAVVENKEPRASLRRTVMGVYADDPDFTKKIREFAIGELLSDDDIEALRVGLPLCQGCGLKTAKPARRRDPLGVLCEDCDSGAVMFG